MRPDINPKTVVRVDLIGTRRIEFPNGAVTEAADYTGYRADAIDGSLKLFLSLSPEDLSVDWLDITAHAYYFITSISGGDLTPDAMETTSRKK